MSDLPPKVDNPKTNEYLGDPAREAQLSTSRAQEIKADSDSLVNLATAVRWGTTTVGLLWAAALRTGLVDIALGVVLLAYALYRTFQPVSYRQSGVRSLLAVIVELTITSAVVVATGCWESPYIFALTVPVIAAGFARGFWHAFRIAITATLAVGLSALLLDRESGFRPAIGWSIELLLVAAVASYGSRLLARAEQVDALNLSQLWRLNEANALLVSLNRLAHDTPVSFDFQETVSSALQRVKDATNPDLTALLLLEPLSSVWSVAIAEGSRVPESFAETQLPTALTDVAHRSHAQLVLDLGTAKVGLDPESRSAIYVPLWAGTRQVGLLAVESHNRNQLGLMHLGLLRELAEPIALTIDNARWFERLRARGAVQERTRIARDLHDRVGQGVAYVAFELDRLSERAAGTELEIDLGQLRTDARAMVTELRETLYDLRTDVSESRGLQEVVSEFLGRVAKRSSLEVQFHHKAEHRLALAQEREVWRICQEAIVNVERHADAANVSVTWDVDNAGGASLEIVDDGVGVGHGVTGGAYGDSNTPGRPSYGLTGMRERAESIGGKLEITPGPTSGTVVRLTMGTRRFMSTPRARSGER